jgi:hypothetical protein
MWTEPRHFTKTRASSTSTDHPRGVALTGPPLVRNVQKPLTGGVAGVVNVGLPVIEAPEVECPALPGRLHTLAERGEFTVLRQQQRHTNHFPGGPELAIGLPAIRADLPSPNEQVSPKPCTILVRGPGEETTQRITIRWLRLLAWVRTSRRHCTPPRAEGSMT